MPFDCVKLVFQKRRLRSVGYAIALLIICWPVAAQNTSPSGELDSSTPARFLAAADRLFFAADDGVHGRELWSCGVDGVATLAADCEPGPVGSDPIILGSAGAWVYFLATTSEFGTELWSWDPGDRAARIVCDVNPGKGSSSSSFLGESDGFCYFSVMTDLKNTPLLWALTTGQHDFRRLEDCGVPVPTNSTALLPDGAMVFVGGSSLWKAVGGRATVIIEPETNDLRAVDPRGNVRHAGANVVFVAEDTEHGSELWVTNGTRPGTHLLRDIRPGPRGSNILQSFSAGNIVFFQADDGEHGIELWVTDGTKAGTRLIKDIHPGSAPSDPHYFAIAGELCYFAADDGVHGIELWKTDGTEAGTALVVDLYPGVQGSGPWSLRGNGDVLYFGAKSPTYGEEPYMTKGSAGTTTILRDIVPGSADSGPGNFAVLSGVLFFSASDPRHGEELWMSHGAADTTRLATDIRAVGRRKNPLSAPHELIAVENLLCFVASDRDHGEELWTCDGTTERTVILKDVFPGPTDSAPKGLTSIGHRFFFSAVTPGIGRELWLADTSNSDTRLVADLAPGPANGNPRFFLGRPPYVYFVADTGAAPPQIWRCNDDGAQLAPLDEPAPNQTRFGPPFELRGQLYCVLRSPGADLLLRDLLTPGSDAAVPRTLSFGPSASRNSAEPSVSTTDHQRVGLDPGLVVFMAPPRSIPNATPPVTIDNVTYFCGRTPETGAELWKTDGTPQNTILVVDAFAGPGSSSPALLTAVGNALYFLAEHPREGRVLWRTRGAAETTEFVRPFDPTTGLRSGGIAATDMVFVPPDTLVLSAPGPTATPIEDREIQILTHLHEEGVLAPCKQINLVTGSYPHHLTRVNNSVFFAADDGIHGEELWVLDLNEEVKAPRLVKDILEPPAPRTPPE